MYGISRMLVVYQSFTFDTKIAMKRFITVTLLFLGGFLCWAEQNNQYLVINPEGHRSLIYDATVDKKGNIVSGSFDKTIKVWDSKNGSELKAFRGQIGPGSEGTIYAIALSDDNKYLAAAGWFGADDESESLGDIRIFDYETRKLVQLLEFHENTVHDLAFRPGTHTLLSGDGDGIIASWNADNGKLLAFYNSGNVYFNDFAVAEDYFVSGHKDGMVFIWDNEKSKPKKKQKFFAKKKLSINVQSSIAMAPGGERYAVLGEELGMILIFNNKHKLESYFFIDNGESIKATFSPNGKRLLISVKDPGENHALVFEEQGKEWNQIAKFDQHDDLVLACGFINNNTCFSSGGLRNEIYTWKVKNPDKILSSSGANSTGYYSANFNNSQLAFSRVPNKAIGFSDYTQVFDIFSRSFKEEINEENFDYPILEDGGYSLESAYPVQMHEDDPNEYLYVKKERKYVDSIPRYYWDGYGHNAYTLTTTDYLITGGENGMLEAYNMETFFRGKFVGHEGGIRSITMTRDRKFVITGGLDMTIRVWRTSDIGLEKPNVNPGTVWEYCEEVFVEEVFHRIIMDLGLTQDAKRPTVEAWNNVIDGLESNGYPAGFIRMRLSSRLYQDIYPVVSIFIAENNEWVIWNNEGYFTSSKRGAKYVGYHINQGKNKEAKFYPFEQFDLKYNRPDIILHDLEIADAGILDIYKRAYEKRILRMGISPDELSDYDIHAPEIEILNYTKDEESNCTFSVKAKDSKYALNRINVYHNDVPVFGRDGIDISNEAASNFQKDFDLQLIPGKNKIQFSVLNQKGVESLRETVYIENKVERKSDLYVVAIGVSDFKDENYNLNYAAKDAEDIITLMKNNKGYEKVNTLMFTNLEVQKSILPLIQDFFTKARPEDVVMLYIAGHGVLSNDLDYYYATHDMDFTKPEKNGISYADLEAIFDKISSIKKLLIMDTCHSGDLNKDDLEEIAMTESDDDENIVFRTTQSTTTFRERQGLKETNETMKEMFNDINKGTGTTVISSAGGVEFAFESEEWKNGLFTYCLLNGLSSLAADRNKDGSIYLSELQRYINTEVTRLSNGMQTPTARVENISLDYLIWK